MTETPETNKPDFRNGFPIRDLRDGSMISGQADSEELVLGRRGDEWLESRAVRPREAGYPSSAVPCTETITDSRTNDIGSE
jgi:hypothetical protein